ncbi:MAG: GNAT family N-acetyltransferase [Actinophytocola sp.]|nr:GNAT family N-acetyltransferase [Actinophytocola sp.]
MEPVEINAGTYYLRQLRADDRIDDRHALVDAFADAAMRRYLPQHRLDTLDLAAAYIADRSADWLNGSHCAWAIANPTTGQLLGEVGLKDLGAAHDYGAVAVWVHPDARHQGVATVAVDTAIRFGFGALGLDRVDYECDDDNAASLALAARCGFTLVGPTTTLAGIPSQLWQRAP